MGVVTRVGVVARNWWVWSPRLGGCGHQGLVGVVIQAQSCEEIHRTRAIILFHERPSLLLLLSLHEGAILSTPPSPLFQVIHTRNASGYVHTGACNGQHQQDTEDSAWWVCSLCFLAPCDARATLDPLQCLLYSKCL